MSLLFIISLILKKVAVQKHVLQTAKWYCLSLLFSLFFLFLFLFALYSLTSKVLPKDILLCSFNNILNIKSLRKTILKTIFYYINFKDIISSISQTFFVSFPLRLMGNDT